MVIYFNSTIITIIIVAITNYYNIIFFILKINDNSNTDDTNLHNIFKNK